MGTLCGWIDWNIMRKGGLVRFILIRKLKAMQKLLACTFDMWHFFWTTPLISCYAAEQCVLNGRGGESDRADYNLYVACLADPSMQYVLELDDSELVK